MSNNEMRSEESKLITYVGFIILLAGIVALFLALPSGFYSCPANGCDLWLINATNFIYNFFWFTIGLLSIGIGLGTIIYGRCYDNHRRRGLMLLTLSIFITIAIIGSLLVASENYLVAHGIQSLP
jgi:hypothetical protein